LIVNICRRVHEDDDVVLRSHMGMLDYQLVITFNSNARQTHSLKARHKNWTQTVIAATGITIADDEDARTVS